MTKETGLYSGEKTVFAINGVRENWTYTSERMKLYPLSNNILKANTKDLNVKT